MLSALNFPQNFLIFQLVHAVCMAAGRVPLGSKGARYLDVSATENGILCLGLSSSTPFSSFVVWLMMPCLTDVWKLNFNDAAAIVNVWRGLMSMLPICMLYIADTVTVINDKGCPVQGFGLLAMSTPPVFTKETGSCAAYQPDSLISMGYIKPWSFKFGIPAISTTAATLIFDAGRLYERVKRSDDCTFFLDHTNDLRFLDKAATFVPNQHSDRQKRNRWRLCRVTEVEETKLVIRSIGMCSFFIICGLVSAIGHTYFISQENHLKRKKFPLLLLPYICDMSKSDYSNLYSSFGSSSKYHPPIGIGISMILAIICCIVASKVETKRLNEVARHGLFDKPDAEIPLSIAHLIPQFALLGALDGIFELSVVSFVKNQVPTTMSPYLTWLSEGIRGVGTVSSVPSVFVVGKLSQSDGKPSCFQDTLNRSRLDSYYRTLAFLVSVNLVFYSFVAYRFKFRDSSEFKIPEYSPYQETADEIMYEDPEDLRSNLGG
ncbi:protein NRT1/ PTR FAMILY 5.5-like [Hibiscus syriacus]|uniref:protein NRT1/ PTR FAMILY 5.5-like n=1 Tax=Hibiscus syriacus TaxID=106335 RepID=UPI001922BBEA|nr:protein NRT1/ PTR FAMILY 5.5-like [Hibiscus syriacus]